MIKVFDKLSKSYNKIELELSGKISNSIQDLIKINPFIKFKGLIPENEYYQFIKNADVLMVTRVDTAFANTGFPLNLANI